MKPRLRPFAQEVPEAQAILQGVTFVEDVALAGHWSQWITLARVVNTPLEASIRWAKGVPSVPRGDGMEIKDLASRVATTLKPVYSLWPVGFRAYCRSPDKKIVPWVRWDPKTTSYCVTLKKHRLCNASYCLCGFHVAEDPWNLSEYFYSTPWPRWTVLVVAPTVGARYARHRVGWRVEQYDVLAAVVPLDYPATDKELVDGRLIRARNLPARAYEIAWALRQFCEEGEATNEREKRRRAAPAR